MRVIRQGIHLLSMWCGWVGSAAIMLVAFLIAFDIIMRWLGQQTIWIAEISLYLMIWFALLNAVPALLTGSHFRITFLVTKLDPRVRMWMEAVQFLVIFIYVGLIMFSGFKLVITSYTYDIRSSTSTALPVFVPQLAIPICSIFLILVLVSTLTRSEMARPDEGGENE